MVNLTAKTLVITGAAGYIGRAAVAAARQQGHAVRAIVRNPNHIPPEWVSDPKVTVFIADLATGPDALKTALKGAHSVIHAAGTFSCLAQDQAQDTHAATASILQATHEGNIPKFVLLSSISVYDTSRVPEGSALTEDSPIEANPDTRDLYCQAKLAQENAAKNAFQNTETALLILRVGAVFGPDRLWNAHLGPPKGPLLFLLEKQGEIPLCQVETCATVLVKAATLKPGTAPPVDIINVLDNDLPTRARFVAALRVSGWPRIVIPLTWRILLIVAKFLPDRPTRIGLLRAAILTARFKPLIYSNKRLHERLDGVTMMTFEEAMTQAIKQSRL